MFLKIENHGVVDLNKLVSIAKNIIDLAEDPVVEDDEWHHSLRIALDVMNQLSSVNDRRIKFGRVFEFNPTSRFWANVDGGELVNIFVPTDPTRDFYVVFVPSTQDVHKLTGENAENRAFSIATGLIKRDFS